MKVEGASLLYAHPPESGERPIFPLQALAEGLQMTLADLGIFRVFVGIGKGYGDKPPLESSEGSAVDACKMSQEVPAAFPGEPIHLSLRTTTMTCTGIVLPPGLVIFNGDTGDRTSYSIGTGDRTSYSIGEVSITLI